MKLKKGFHNLAFSLLLFFVVLFINLLYFSAPVKAAAPVTQTIKKATLYFCDCGNSVVENNSCDCQLCKTEVTGLQTDKCYSSTYSGTDLCLCNKASGGVNTTPVATRTACADNNGGCKEVCEGYGGTFNRCITLNGLIVASAGSTGEKDKKEERPEIPPPPFPNPFESSGISTPQALIGKIINFVLGAVGSLALLMFVYGGITWMTSSGNQENVKKGRGIIIWSAIGLAIIFMAYGLTRVLLSSVTN
jgi:hypothetical protein